ncbi:MULTISPECIES: hypothetical protein [Pontibacillus]|uniref:Uncharacterized protein n=1 Tax=Pontibacillus chungwhensis TaxID=265426 RepID=A0ABY8UU19_9BACI|nr:MULTISPECIES: hypothetical protein [Pontibacillus]MCD5323149.1 hypothetical protein [Pontibacillus sp. HN14]WIF96537.1 hypothetical protein QNI29_12325 [Pontibacillus chungwhensis]
MVELFFWALASFIIVMVSGAFGMRELFVRERWWWPSVTLLCVALILGGLSGLMSLFTSQLIELDKPAVSLYYAIRTICILSSLSLVAFIILWMREERERLTLPKGLRLVENRRQKKEGASQ